MRERLALILKELNLSKDEFAIAIKVSVGSIYKYLSGEVEITESFQRKLYKSLPSISREWFETGKGQMLIGNPETPESSVAEKREDYLKSEDKDFIIKNQEKVIVQQRETISQLLHQCGLLQNK
jgi:transcriptional regulator with XRE-family HTH domain